MTTRPNQAQHRADMKARGWATYTRPAEADRYPKAWTFYEASCLRGFTLPSADLFREAVARHEAAGGQDQVTRQAAASRTLMAALDRRIEAARRKERRRPLGPIRIF